MMWLRSLPLHPRTSRVQSKVIARFAILSVFVGVGVCLWYLRLQNRLYQAEGTTHQNVRSKAEPPESRVGKVHAVFGEQRNPVYERALALHQEHSEANGHPMFVLRERILSGLWSKPAFILGIIVEELARPREERLQWLMYVSASFIWATYTDLLAIGGMMLIPWS